MNTQQNEDDFMERVKPEPNEAVLLQVLEHTGDLWQLGSPIPGDPPIDPKTKQPVIDPKTGLPMVAQSKIVRMFENDDLSVDVFSLPLPGAPNDQNKTAFIHNVRPMAIKRTTSLARFDVWREMLEEQVLEGGDEPPDPEDLKPELTNVIPMTNGATS